ncbi:hypothetical protein AB4Y55_25490 [Serratia nematodiphila]
MSTEKPSEPSKPVATVDVQRGRPDGNMFGVAWSSAGHALPDGPHFLYSQEYVSALLAELEAKDKRIAELEAKTAMTMGVGSGNGNLFVHGDYDSIKAAQAIALENESLRTKLATPVRLAEKYNMKMAGDKSTKSMFYGHNSAINDSAKAIRAAGFKVDGDE